MPDGYVGCPSYAYNVSNHDCECNDCAGGRSYLMSYDFAWRMPYILDFELPLKEIEIKIHSLKTTANKTGIDVDSTVISLEKELNEKKNQIY